MARLDVKSRRIQAKLVYYGPGLCGKTTNLQYINGRMAKDQELMSLATEGDMTIFFDFMPLDLGKLRGMDVQFKLYTVPGQVRYNQTRKMVLKNVDGIVFVADSQPLMADSNIESFQNLFENLEELGIAPDGVPIILQYNKQDLPGVLDADAMDAQLNPKGYPIQLASAFTGQGVVETLKLATKEVLAKLTDELSGVAGAPPRGAFPSHVTTKKGVRPSPAPAANAPAAPAVGAAAAPPASSPAATASSSDDAPAWFDRWATERMKQETLMRSDLILTVSGMKRTEASLQKALGELETLRKDLGRAAGSEAAASGLIEKLDALAGKVAAAATESGQQSILTLLRATSSKPALDLSGLVTKSDVASLQKTLLEAAAKSESGAAPKAPSVGPDLTTLLANVATKEDLRELSRAARASGPGPGPGVSDTTKIETKLERLTELVTKADLGAETTRLSKEIARGLQAGLAALPTKKDLQGLGGGPPIDLSGLEKKLDALPQPGLGSLERKIDELPTRADIEALLRSVNELTERLAALERRATEPEVRVAQAAPRVAGAVGEGAGEASGDGTGDDAAATGAATTDTMAASAAPGGDEPEAEPARVVANAEAPPIEAPVEGGPPPTEEAESAPTAEAAGASAKAVDTTTAKAETADAADTTSPKAETATEADTTSAKAETADAADTTSAKAETADAAETTSAKAETADAADTTSARPETADAADTPSAKAETETPTAGTGEVPEVATPAAESTTTAEPMPDAPPDDARHKNAARVARVMIADLYLYQRDDVEAGLREGDFEERNKESLTDIRTTYESRVPEDVRAEFDHVAAELEKAKKKWRKRLSLE